MAGFPLAEKNRADCYNRRREIQVMIDYLMKGQENQQASIKEIVQWTQIADPTSFTSKDIDRVRVDHEAKLERYRKRQDWEAWIEENEMDIEAERVLAEAKNFRAEMQFI